MYMYVHMKLYTKYKILQVRILDGRKQICVYVELLSTTACFSTTFAHYYLVISRV